MSDVRLKMLEIDKTMEQEAIQMLLFSGGYLPQQNFPGKCIMSLFLSSKERNNQMVGLSSEAHLEVITIATDHCHRLHCHRSLPGQQKVQKTTVPPLLCETKECIQTILWSLSDLTKRDYLALKYSIFGHSLASSTSSGHIISCDFKNQNFGGS